MFTASHDDYISGLKKKDKYEDELDWKTSANHYNDVCKKVNGRELKVKLVNVRKTFRKDIRTYKIARLKVENVISKFSPESRDYLKKNEDVSIYLESLEEKCRNREPLYDCLCESLDEVTKACRAIKRENPARDQNFRV